jgi:hypothetical protein
VAIPSEHGGWSLTLEPAILGLVVAPSGAGVALAAAALAGFLLRTPLKFSVGDRLRGRYLPRTRQADIASSIYATALAGLVVLAVLAGSHPFWVPLVLAIPLFVGELAFDVRSRSRRLVPELAGTVGIGSAGAAVVLAGGGSVRMAAAVWIIAAARAIAAIPFVRLQLRRGKHQPYQTWTSDAAQALAVMIALSGVLIAGLPVSGLAAIIGLGLFHVVAGRRPVPPVPVIGAQQVVLGLTVVLIAGLGLRAP